MGVINKQGTHERPSCQDTNATERTGNCVDCSYLKLLAHIYVDLVWGIGTKRNQQMLLKPTLPSFRTQSALRPSRHCPVPPTPAGQPGSAGLLHSITVGGGHSGLSGSAQLCALPESFVVQHDLLAEYRVLPKDKCKRIELLVPSGQKSRTEGGLNKWPIFSFPLTNILCLDNIQSFPKVV